MRFDCRHHRGLLLVAVLLSACDKAERIGPGASRPVSIRVDGPTQVVIPSEATFVAVQTWSDGSTRDVTAASHWTSTNPSVLSISAGRGTPVAGGEVAVTVQFEGRTSLPKQVMVVPSTPEWAGGYRLTIGGGACVQGTLPLPVELRQRTYNAVVTQTGLALSVRVNNAGSFEGRIFNPQVRFFIFGPSLRRRAPRTSITKVLYETRPARYSSGTPQSMLEVFPDGKVLVVGGEVTTTMSPSGFDGTLNGALALFEPSTNAFVGVCSSPSHAFVLRRN